MTYTPINWQTGDTITAEKMNKMDNGWGVSSSSQILFSETVTTEDDGGEAWGMLAYSGTIEADTLSITFDGTTYICPKISTGSFGNVYGGWDGSEADFSTIPFLIWAAGHEIQTASAGTFAISASAEQSSVETSADFQKAVLSAGVFIATQRITTWQEIHDAIAAGKDVRINSASGSNVYSEPVYSATFDGTTYEVSAIFIDGGAATARYYIAESANSVILAN